MAKKSNAAKQAHAKREHEQEENDMRPDPRLLEISEALTQGDIKRARALAAAMGASIPTSI